MFDFGAVVHRRRGVKKMTTTAELTKIAGLEEELAEALDQLETFKGDKWTKPELTRARIEALEMTNYFLNCQIETLVEGLETCVYDLESAMSWGGEGAGQAEVDDEVREYKNILAQFQGKDT